MLKEVRHYMEHDGLVEKPRVEKPPDSDDDVLDEVALDMYISVEIS